MKTSLILFLFSFNAFALDCGGIPEGTVVRLDRGEGSLAKAAVQDQDGIGSCYANQAALLLQSVLPGNPNLSYLNLGLFYTQENNLPTARKAGDTSYTRDKLAHDKTILKDAGTAIWGGTSCGTINLIKEKQKSAKFGGICKAEDVNLEHQFFDPKTKANFDVNHKQNESIASASKYMNAYQHKFGYAFDKNQPVTPEYLEKRKKADEFRDALKKFVDTNSSDYLLKKCTQPDPDKIEKIIDSTITKAFLNSKGCYDHRMRIKTDLPICKTFDKVGFLYTKASSAGTSVAAYELGKDYKKKLSAQINSVMTSTAGFEGFLKEVQSSLATYEVVKNAPAPKTRAGSTSAQKNKVVKKYGHQRNSGKIEEKNPAPPKDFAEVVLENLSPEDKNTLESEYKRVALKEMDECKSKFMIEFFKDKDAFVKAALSDSVLCNHVDLLQRASEFAGVLPLKTFNNVSSFVGFLTDKAGLDYDEGLLAMMASDCTPDKRIKIPETITCEETRINFEPADFQGNAISSKAKTVILENRNKLFSNLKNNRAIGIDICTKFWKDDTYDFHKDNPETKDSTCSTSGDHGFHAITMIGYRCQNNKIQYLSQNSWGPSWEIGAAKYDIEDGKVWMDEDRVFKNLSTIDYITP